MYVKGVQICVIIYFQCNMQPGLNLKLCSLNTIVFTIRNYSLICLLSWVCDCKPILYITSTFPVSNNSDNTDIITLSWIIFLPACCKTISLSYVCALNLTAVSSFCLSDSHMCNPTPPHFLPFRTHIQAFILNSTTASI